MTEIRIDSIEWLPEAVTQFLNGLEPGKVVALYGPMGAGKTTLVGEICKQLGTEDEVSSPTFSIVNEYDTTKWGKIYHLDCYRLKDEDEALDAGVEDYFYSGNTCFVEWPEKISSLVPDDAVMVDLIPDTEGKRILKIKY